MTLNELLNAGLPNMGFVSICRLIEENAEMSGLNYDGCPSWLEYEFDIEGNFGCIHIYPDDECIQDEERVDELIEALEYENWDEAIEYIDSYYVVIWNDKDKEVIGYKDFGFSKKEILRLSNRG